MKTVVRFLVVSWDGDARVTSRRPQFHPGEAIYRLILNLPEPRIAGDIRLEIPELEMPAPVVEDAPVEEGMPR